MELICLVGATGVGKTQFAIELALKLKEKTGQIIPILSADSRQIFKEMKIGTSMPSEEMQKLVPHYFIANASIKEYYNAAHYAKEASQVIDSLYKKNIPYAIICGGSMMYIDALLYGIDEIPDVDPEIRKNVYDEYQHIGIEPIYQKLCEIDPDYCKRIDKKNYKRILHAYEVFLSSKQPFSSFHLKNKKKSKYPFKLFCLDRDRVDLYNRINLRVDKMIEEGLINEAKKLYPYAQFNALNTIGYKELFSFFEGKITCEKAIQLIKKNSRIYARKQLTWWKKNKDIKYIPISTDLNIFIKDVLKID